MGLWNHFCAPWLWKRREGEPVLTLQERDLIKKSETASKLIPENTGNSLSDRASVKDEREGGKFCATWLQQLLRFITNYR